MLRIDAARTPVRYGKPTPIDIHAPSQGRLEISNNAAENQIRPVALGRKNWLFSGSDSGGERAAAFYTLIRTAKLNGVEPEAWLTDVIARIGAHLINRLAELLPWTWSPLTTHSVAA